METDDLRPAHRYRPGQTEPGEGASGTYRVDDSGPVDAWRHGTRFNVPSIVLRGLDPFEEFPSIAFADAFGKRVTFANGQGPSRKPEPRCVRCWGTTDDR